MNHSNSTNNRIHFNLNKNSPKLNLGRWVISNILYQEKRFLFMENSEASQESKQQGKQTTEAKTLSNSDRIVLSNEVIKYKRSALNSEAKITYQQLPAFTNISRNVNSFIREIDKSISNRDDQLVLRNNARVLYDGLKNTYKAGLQENIKQLEQWQNNYRKAYSEQLEPEDPQREIIKRQSFDTKISALDEPGLENYINSLNERPTLSLYEANKLLATVKGNNRLYLLVKTYISNNNIGDDYKNTPEWNNIAKHLTTLKGFAQRDEVWYLKDGHLHPLNFSQLLADKLKNYDVTDINQRRKYFKAGH